MTAMNADVPGDDLFIPPLNSKLMMIDFSRAARMTDASDLTTVFKAFPIAAPTDHLGYVEVELIPGERWPGAYGRRFVFPVLMFTEGKCLDFRRMVEALKRTLHRRELQLVEFIDLGMADRAYIHYLAERIREAYRYLNLNFPATHHEDCHRFKEQWLQWERNDALASYWQELPSDAYTPLLALELEGHLADMRPASAAVTKVREAQQEMVRKVSGDIRHLERDYQRYVNTNRVPAESIEGLLLKQRFETIQLITCMRPLTKPDIDLEMADFYAMMDRLEPDFQSMRAERYRAHIARHSRWQRLLHHLNIRRIEE